MGNAEDEKQPEQVDALQACQQPKGDALADPTFVLLRDPIQLKGPDGAEFGQRSVQDDDVEVVAAIDPDADEEGEVGDGNGGVEVAADFGRLSKERLLVKHLRGQGKLIMDSRQGKNH